MRVYITNLNGHAPGSTAQICQNMVVDLAMELGYRELSIHAYRMENDTPQELSKRLDGILAGLRKGDVVIFQTPTWNTTAFDEQLMSKLKTYDIKIIIFIHDVVPLMFAGNYYLMDRTIAYYNMADVIIAPSQSMLDVLVEHGLNVPKMIVQGMWDHPTNAPQSDAAFKQLIHFPGSPERFGFVKEWEHDVQLNIYSNKAITPYKNVHYYPYRPDEQLVMEMSHGGFGLVWMDEHDQDYQKLYCPYKLGTFLAAGIPVIVQKGIANQEIIERNGLGLIVSSLNEATQLIRNMDGETYRTLVRHVREFNPLLRQGFFTKKILIDSVFRALCKGEEDVNS